LDKCNINQRNALSATITTPKGFAFTSQRWFHTQARPRFAPMASILTPREARTFAPITAESSHSIESEFRLAAYERQSEAHFGASEENENVKTELCS
jgi:hypothetical protein